MFFNLANRFKYRHSSFVSSMRPDEELLDLIRENSLKEYVFYDKRWFDKNGNWIITFNSIVRVFRYMEILTPKRCAPNAFTIYLPPAVQITLQPFASAKIPTMMSFIFDQLNVACIAPGFICNNKVEVLPQNMENEKLLKIEVRNRTPRVVTLPHSCRIGQLVVLSRTGTSGHVDMAFMN
jgi:hypothetical protein